MKKNKVVKNKSLLIIEDSHYDYLLIKNIILSKYPDLNILYASCLEEAYELFKKSHYNILLVDLNLPDGFGLGTIQEVKKYHGHTPILAITGVQTASIGKTAESFGAESLMFKENLLNPSFFDNFEKALRLEEQAA